MNQPPRVDTMTVRIALRRLGKVYRPIGPKDEVADVWLRVLAKVGRDEFVSAIDGYLSSDAQYFPKPGEILARAKKLRKAAPIPQASSFADDYHAWCQHYDGPCPVCGAVWGSVPKGANRNPKFIGDKWHPGLPPLRKGVLHIKKDHDALSVPVRWRDGFGVVHDGFWR